VHAKPAAAGSQVRYFDEHDAKIHRLEMEKDAKKFNEIYYGYRFVAGIPDTSMRRKRIPA
jgi:hypothetical protein